MNADYRIEDKENIYLSGEPHTGFKLFAKRGDHHEHVGQFFAPEWNLTDEQLVNFVISELEESDDFDLYHD